MFENLTITAILLLSGSFLVERIRKMSRKKTSAATGAGCESGCGRCGPAPTVAETPLRMSS